MYHTLNDLVCLAEGKKMPVWAVVLENEKRQNGLSEEEIFKSLEARYAVMEASAGKALEKDAGASGTLIGGCARAQYLYAQESEGCCGSFINLVMARALSSSEVNASMGKICAAPTAGSCGVLPAVVVSLAERERSGRREILEALLTAAGIGTIMMKNATVSGAEGGCQAECGVAAAMAAGAAVTLLGGTAEMIAESAAFALINCMGLVCDPVAGLVQYPCAVRNASQAVNALLSADLALSGTKNVIPPDEIVEAMYRVGRLLPAQLKETAMGGVAATKTARKIQKKIFGP